MHRPDVALHNFTAVIHLDNKNQSISVLPTKIINLNKIKKGSNIINYNINTIIYTNEGKSRVVRMSTIQRNLMQFEYGSSFP